ncbi:MAG: hypothetical protein MRERV_64c006 [Mycoplasmataceae bacterium RV_VA103A]|nr:MAG: hypothetical protein MRERV_64c006 [Mycoplasmataceae bacterium RV_VA103A]
MSIFSVNSCCSNAFSVNSFSFFLTMFNNFAFQSLIILISAFFSSGLSKLIAWWKIWDIVPPLPKCALLIFCNSSLLWETRIFCWISSQVELIFSIFWDIKTGY